MGVCAMLVCTVRVGGQSTDCLDRAHSAADRPSDPIRLALPPQSSLLAHSTPHPPTSAMSFKNIGQRFQLRE